MEPSTAQQSAPTVPSTEGFLIVPKPTVSHTFCELMNECRATYTQMRNTGMSDKETIWTMMDMAKGSEDHMHAVETLVQEFMQLREPPSD